MLTSSFCFNFCLFFNIFLFFLLDLQTDPEHGLWSSKEPFKELNGLLSLDGSLSK